MTNEEQKCCEKGQDPKCCSPEQIRECHGDVAEHPCCGQDKDKKEEN